MNPARHEYRVPASSRAVTRRTVAIKSKAAPTKSTRPAVSTTVLFLFLARLHQRGLVVVRVVPRNAHEQHAKRNHSGGNAGRHGMSLLVSRSCSIPLTYLKRNTHLHVDESLMAPPIMGPTNRETEKAIDTSPVYVAYRSGEAKSKNITNESEYIPAPPMPWNAR